MNVTLVSPPITRTENVARLRELDDHDNTCLSIGLYTLGAILKEQGHTVRLLNQALSPWSGAIDEIAAGQPEVVGVACMTRYRNVVGEMVQAIRTRLPNTKIVLGGVHASILYNQILERWPGVDFIAVGEADRSFPELIRRLEADHEPWGIPGIAARRGDGSVDWSGPAEPIADLGTLPIPARHYAYDIISTARGCPFNCTFCCSASVWGRHVRTRPVAHVIEEMELLRRQHNIRQVHFKDETFTLNRSRVKEICQAMLDAKLGMWWTCDTRVDCMDEERLYWMRKAGCHYISLGIESGSPRLLKSINKKTSPDKIREATELARSFGFYVRYYLIGGLPGEETEDLEATLRLVQDARPHFVAMNTLTLTPGAAVCDQYYERTGRDESIWFESGPMQILNDPHQNWRETAAGKALHALNNVGN